MRRRFIHAMKIRNRALELAHHFDFVVGPAGTRSVVGYSTPATTSRVCFRPASRCSTHALSSRVPFVKSFNEQANASPIVRDLPRRIGSWPQHESIAKITFKSKYLAEPVQHQPI